MFKLYLVENDDKESKNKIVSIVVNYFGTVILDTTVRLVI